MAKKILTEAEKKARKAAYNKKYRSTEKGMKKTKESFDRYSKTERYRELARGYYWKKKEEQTPLAPSSPPRDEDINI